MTLKFLSTLAFCCAVFTTVFSQTSIYEVQTSNPLRKTILDVVRKPTAAELGQPIEFIVNGIYAKGNWAFVYGQLQQPGGKALDHSKFADKDYVEQSKAELFDNNFQALLLKKKGKWTIAERALGCTDVCWLEWADRKDVPQEIFPHNMEEKE